MVRRMLALTALVVALPASAGPCDAHVRKAATAKGDALVAAYSDLLACDGKVADESFDDFMRASGDVPTLVALSLASIDAAAYYRIWKMPASIRDYSQRTEVAIAVGEGCEAHPNVVPFVQGAYGALTDFEFAAWDDVLTTCDHPDLVAWLRELVAKPPASAYDEKYSTVTNAYIHHVHAEALPVLQAASIDAARSGGPFTSLVEAMQQSIEPEFGQEVAPEARARLETAMLAVAAEVGPEQAALVADRLYNAGAEGAAASLLPRIYPERVQPDGSLLYGTAAIEVCDAQAVVHHAEVREPAKRWSILAEIDAPLQAFKPRLKCESERPWPVLATNEPVRDASEIEAWLGEISGKWEARGNTVTLRAEKAIVLP